MKLAAIFYTNGDTPTVLRLDCVLDDAAAADPDLVRANLAETLSVPGTLKAGLIVLDVPDDAIRPYLASGAPSTEPPILLLQSSTPPVE